MDSNANGKDIPYWNRVVNTQGLRVFVGLRAAVDCFRKVEWNQG